VTKGRALIDTGPIVATLREKDEHHVVCREELSRRKPPLYTCWPVVTEAAWLLRDDPVALEGLFRAFHGGMLVLLPIDESAMPWLDDFLRRYRSIRAQLADAALVYLAEREGIRTIFTLDRRDFGVYRYGRNRSLKIVPAI
jgi:uncharacterized protein